MNEDLRPHHAAHDDESAAVGTALLDPPTRGQGGGRGGDPHHWPPPAAGSAGGAGWLPPSQAPPWAPPPPYRAPVHPLARLALAAVVAALAVASGVLGFVIGNRPAPTTTGSLSPSTAARGGSVAPAADKWVVDVNTVLGYQGARGAGTGIVLTSSGEVLTNNHVVEGATQISVTDVGNGRSYRATVVGTDASADVAVLQLSGASGLATARLGDSGALAVGDAVTAIGNAGGVGGTPSVASGVVVALDQQITASDSLSGTSEQLSGMIETSATLEPGDSGGPLVDASGRVVGIDTAGSSGFQFPSGSSANFAIPIDTALPIARQIEAGRSSSTVHVGPAAFLGVSVSSADGTGALIVNVVSSSPAAGAGLQPGDVIDSLDGRSVTSPADLSAIMETLEPGMEAQVGWVDASGLQHTTQLQLASGPPA
jgi:S1-C subfamily serine protease